MKKIQLNSKWLSFWFGWGFDLTYETCGYFDARHRITISLIFFTLIIVLPIWSNHTQECVPPKWGIAYHGDIFWIHTGGKGNMNGGNKWITIHMPWQWDWVRTSVLRKDTTWEHETKNNEKSFWKDKWKDIIWEETHPYTYTLRSGKVQNRLATIRVEEREWRWRGLRWLPHPNRIKKTIAIEFNGEVGEKTGSWKGGCTGCSFKLQSDETPLQSLRRMEKERIFN